MYFERKLRNGFRFLALRTAQNWSLQWCVIIPMQWSRRKAHPLSQKKFRCTSCPYAIKKKCTLKDHEQFHCPNLRRTGQVAKEEQCKFCPESFTHNALRHHLNGSINAEKFGRRPRGKHAAITKQQFVDHINKNKSNKS